MFAALYAGKIIADILAKEGAGALFKGALPRALWVAPLGAMNFAGYELAKGALKDRSGEGRVGESGTPDSTDPLATGSAAA